MTFISLYYLFLLSHNIWIMFQQEKKLSFSCKKWCKYKLTCKDLFEFGVIRQNLWNFVKYRLNLVLYFSPWIQHMSASWFYNTRVMVTWQYSFACISRSDAPKLLLFYTPDSKMKEYMHQNVITRQFSI